jgi:hypothetical protein
MTEDLSTPEQVHADLCLKFPDEAAAFATLYEPVTQTVTTYDEEGAASTVTAEVEGEFKPRHTASIDTIGVIYQPIGDMDAEGNFLTAALPGWHVNLRGSFTPEQMEVLAQFTVVPENPVRVWA